LEPGHKPHKGPGDGNGQGLFAGSTPVDNSVAWGGKLWMTATLHAKGGAPCACPSGCVDCAYRSPHLYNNTNMNWRPLYNGSTPTELHLQGAGGGGGGGLTGRGGPYLVDGPNVLDTCPLAGELVCITCDRARGYYPAAYSGSFTSVAGATLTGTGFTCVYAEKCTELSSACGTNFTFVEMFRTVGYLFLFFLFLFGVYNAMRRVKYLAYTCDPNLYIEAANPNYPPFSHPPKFTPGQLGWLRRAWFATDTEILRCTTPDELMVTPKP